MKCSSLFSYVSERLDLVKEVESYGEQLPTMEPRSL
jgi:hypothetical protein